MYRGWTWQWRSLDIVTSDEYVAGESLENLAIREARMKWLIKVKGHHTTAPPNTRTHLHHKQRHTHTHDTHTHQSPHTSRPRSTRAYPHWGLDIPTNSQTARPLSHVLHAAVHMAVQMAATRQRSHLLWRVGAKSNFERVGPLAHRASVFMRKARRERELRRMRRGVASIWPQRGIHGPDRPTPSSTPRSHGRIVECTGRSQRLNTHAYSATPSSMPSLSLSRVAPAVSFSILKA